MSAFQIETMFRRLATQSSLAPVTVGSFTSHRTHVADLPPAERQKLDGVAGTIVAGFRGAHHPIVGVLLVGHSDKDPRGAAFEQQVSVERAEHVLETLAQLVQSRADTPLLRLLVKSVPMRAIGDGAVHRLFTNPTGEPQRAANRRVVLFLAEAIQIGIPVLEGIFLVPPQKPDEEFEGTRQTPEFARTTSALVGRPLIFGGPPLKGAPAFVEGPARRPAIKHDHGFLDDGKGNLDGSKRQSPNDTDRAHKEVWVAILGFAMQRKPELKDATAAYKHFLVDNNGAPLTIRYEGFLTEDANGQTVLKSAVDDTRAGILDLFDAKFPKPPATTKTDKLQATSEAVSVGRALPDFRYPYPASENWQKAIGGHALWISAAATIASDQVARLRKVEIIMTLHAEDMYNFNPNGVDIATATSDLENGRFEIVGLGTEFLQTATVNRTITFTIPLAKQPDNRVVPADQKVVA